MERIQIEKRADMAQKLESIGLSFHSWDNYWKEDVCYKFRTAQIEHIETVTEELHRMAMQAVAHVIDSKMLGRLKIPNQYWAAIEASFIDHKDRTLYGRFDLAYDGTNIKMLEYNADTPTSLLESAVAQWYWMKDKYPLDDQFNSLHEKLVVRWKHIVPASTSVIYFASLSGNEEDWVCCHYLMETAVQAGFEARHVFVEALAFDSATDYFVDGEDQRIEVLFKLYPWEWMMREELGIKVCTTKTQFLEPIWKSVLSNKGILAIMWELFPNHPNLLATEIAGENLSRKISKSHNVMKPLLSREGANIMMFEDGKCTETSTGPYGEEGYVLQQLVELKSFDDKYPVIGSWVVGHEAAGMCIREDIGKITTNMSNFVPHFFTDL